MDANCLFFWLVGFGHLVSEKLIRNRRVVTTQSYYRNFLLFNPRLEGQPIECPLCQQIVAAAPFDGPPNELANRRRFGQNDPRIDIRSIGFAPGNVRLIDEQF